MSRFLLSLLILFTTLQSPPAADVARVLQQAQTLYYQAKFTESIDALLPLDASLRSETGRLNERIEVKLQLALAYIGRGETTEAKSRFTEICALSPDYELDSQRFAPKVIALFGEAKDDLERTRCQTICKRAEDLLASKNAQGLTDLINSDSSKCSCLDTAAVDAAELFYEDGVQAYKQEDYVTALTDFRSAQKLNPQLDFASSYIDITRNQLQLAAERSYIEWTTQMNSREFGTALGTYKKLQAANVDNTANDALGKIRAGYRDRIKPLVESSKQACSRGDSAGVARIRQDAANVIPDANIAGEFLSDFGNCVMKSCLQMTPEAAIVRLISREDPKLPKGAVNRPMRLMVKVRIDERGSVTPTDLNSVDPVLREAVAQAVSTWKFFPATINGTETRCVETEIQLSLNP